MRLIVAPYLTTYLTSFRQLLRHSRSRRVFCFHEYCHTDIFGCHQNFCHRLRTLSLNCTHTHTLSLSQSSTSSLSLFLSLSALFHFTNLFFQISRQSFKTISQNSRFLPKRKRAKSRRWRRSFFVVVVVGEAIARCLFTAMNKAGRLVYFLIH